MNGQRSRWGWYGELPPPLLVAAIIRALFLAFLPLGVWLFARHFKDERRRDQRTPTRAVVLVLLASGTVTILRRPRWAKGLQREDLDEELGPGAGP